MANRVHRLQRRRCPGARTRLSSGEEHEAHLRSLHERGLLDDMSYAGALDPGPPEHAAALHLFLVSVCNGV